ncbi:Transmembrane protein 177 [Dissostichus eleginoides]|uniref:Transmembrane protein 177 n=1 Tax=Dissostichus eleginoides TaxID=100907 RepID=A0AAD9FH33_DISEL|nr:Transmembrane protein 177 [Dissostichus eleginoides]
MASRILKYAVLLQKYRTPLLITSCGGVFGANMFYHMFPDMTYRQLYQAWSKGEPVTMSEKLQDVFQQVGRVVQFIFKITINNRRCQLK